MTFHQEHNHNTTNHFTKDNEFCQQQTEKQRIGFILDDKRDEDMYHSKRLPALEQSYQKRLSNMQFIPYDPSKQSLQRLPSPFHDEETLIKQERMPPTANELEYIKRIQALMTLVARQTKEIQSLREIIKSHNNNNPNNDMPMNRKRNKQS
ncbi:hypothetical protein INT47_006127 [Mucor saturninus]|uniref:Uncharacterized protein n=1 Tax=Mucor saturninus TaxID=64648 RepID=A0A8H7RBS2_9FUNG|nr:hypothetical protein INT47_006127 [Mucor saturninus]